MLRSSTDGVTQHRQPTQASSCQRLLRPCRPSLPSCSCCILWYAGAGGVHAGLSCGSASRWQQRQRYVQTLGTCCSSGALHDCIGYVPLRSCGQWRSAGIRQSWCGRCCNGGMAAGQSKRRVVCWSCLGGYLSAGAGLAEEVATEDQQACHSRQEGKIALSIHARNHGTPRSAYCATLQEHIDLNCRDDIWS